MQRLAPAESPAKTTLEGDWLVQGTRGRVKKREISEERIEEGCREGCLWGKAVANREAAAPSKMCKFGSRRTVGRGIA